MTSPGDRVLPPAEQSELRHDLRTPFNHILGYAEMLLESAGEDGHAELAPALRRLHDDGKDLLGVVNAGLAADRPVTAADLDALGEALARRLPSLTGQVEALAEQARRGGHGAAAGDLERIRRAVALLAALAGGGFARAAAPAAGPPLETSPSSRPPLAPGAVLVVDDIETNRDLLCRRLEREGLTATPAADGTAALAALRSGRFDLMLLDIVMPGVDGYEVLRVAKSTPGLRDIPVVMISALDELESVVRCLELGAEDYLPKPFDPVLLRARVGACLEKKRLRDRELEYLRGVAALEEAASAVEAGSFAPARLDAVAARPDELGRLARVFQHMATEVQARERRLKEQVAQLRIEIDMVRLTKQVEELTQGSVFDSLVGARERLKKRREGDGTAASGGLTPPGE
jgi:CheY-like chemotaxis protein